jgi:hypothetical protein
MFLDHILWSTTVGRPPLDELSACHRELYLTTHNILRRQTSVPPQRDSNPQPQQASGRETLALDRSASGISRSKVALWLNQLPHYEGMWRRQGMAVSGQWSVSRLNHLLRGGIFRRSLNRKMLRARNEPRFIGAPSRGLRHCTDRAAEVWRPVDKRTGARYSVWQAVL